MTNKEITLEDCVKGIEQICSDKDFTKQQILHRARMMYLINKLVKIDDILVLCDFVRAERELFSNTKDLTEESCQKFYKKCTIVNDLKYFLTSNNLMIISKDDYRGMDIRKAET